ELSWRTTSATCSEGAWAGQKPEGVTLDQQATFLSEAYHCMKEDPYLAVALWFPLQDERGIVSGLLHSNGAQKPAFAAMRTYAQNKERNVSETSIAIVHVQKTSRHGRHASPHAHGPSGSAGAPAGGKRGAHSRGPSKRSHRGHKRRRRRRRHH